MQNSSDSDSVVEIMMMTTMMMMMTIILTTMTVMMTMMIIKMMMILIGLELSLMQSVSPPLKYVSSRNFSRFSHQSNSKDSVQNVKHPIFKLPKNRTNARMFHIRIGAEKLMPKKSLLPSDPLSFNVICVNEATLMTIATTLMMMAMVLGLRSHQFFGKMRWLMAKQVRGKKIGSLQISGWDSKFDDFTQSGRGKGRLSLPYLCGDGLR